MSPGRDEADAAAEGCRPAGPAEACDGEATAARASGTASEPPFTRRERWFLLLWGIALTLVFTGLGTGAVITVDQHRKAATERHTSRIDPNATERGLTAAGTAVPSTAGRRRVTVGIYLDDISSVSLVDSAWSVVFYIWFRWTGDGLAPGETFRIVDGEITQKTKLTERVAGSGHYALYLVRARVTKVFNTDRFPVDDHLLTLQIEDQVLPLSRLEYVPDVAGSDVSSRVQMPGYTVSDTGLVMKPHAYRTNFGDPALSQEQSATYSQLIYWVWNTRAGYGPHLGVFAGLYAAVLIALLAFCIKPTAVDPRFGLGIGAFFGAVANMFISASLVPESELLTLMTMVNGIGMLTIFLTLVQSAISFHLYDTRERVRLSQVFDRMSFVIFLAGSLAINISLPYVGMVH
jgi:hypothetical protein